MERTLSVIRQNNTAIRCAKLRRELLSLSTISRLTGVKRGKVYVMVQLGERLLSLELEEEIEHVKCSGGGCEKMGEPNYAWPPVKEDLDEFYCGGSDRCCP